MLGEWVAGQDPKFRERFYDELVHAMRAYWETVIVVSYDDR